MQNYKVFYSWQSDLPNPTNRGFIEKALENAAKAIRADDSIKVEPVIDRDTAGVPGAPDIASTIFAKIEEAQVFACDVSIINEGEKARSTPNPNVLIELGYALKTLGSERILMIMNTAFGGPELLPFDLSKKRVVTYRMPEDCKDRTTERKILKSKLEEALRTILSQIEAQPPEESPVSGLKKFLVDDRYRIQLDELMKNETEKLLNYISAIDSPPRVETDDNPYIQLISDFEEHTSTLRDLMVKGCYYGEMKHNQIWRKHFEQIVNPVGANMFTLKRYPALILLYSAGLSAISAKKYDTLKSLLIETKYIINQERFPLVLCLSPWDIMEESNIRSGLPKQQNKITPVSNHLSELLREPMSSIILDSDYNECFDRFEYFFALVRTCMAERTGRGVNVAVGRFATKHLVRSHGDRIYKSGVVRDIESDVQDVGNNWDPLQADFFNGHIKRFIDIKNGFDKKLERIYFQLRFP